MPVFFDMTGVWLAAPVTEGITFSISIYFICKDLSGGLKKNFKV